MVFYDIPLPKECIRVPGHRVNSVVWGGLGIYHFNTGCHYLTALKAIRADQPFYFDIFVDNRSDLTEEKNLKIDMLYLCIVKDDNVVKKFLLDKTVCLDNSARPVHENSSPYKADTFRFKYNEYHTY
jgi:hypothetical protein